MSYSKDVHHLNFYGVENKRKFRHSFELNFTPSVTLLSNLQSMITSKLLT
ncbi:hypothetical protein VCHA47P369_20003 [Vibrio chagasii]|nr:hypothetical protein VCHA34P116_110181 [Vibrio chagasii]CAH6810320.1 hypothetical protein VCHA28FP16_120145 [Vibrio chagasii]CAH6830487.1 hypothetical protein VCHA31O71_10003 [Vibrio chagasii]CAH6831596.1 hypothetical protein VCHA35O137_10003 [Vibrio chagasii]CAH6862787.1 hypothetical protein VCHA36O163_11027 [Vibrio chagasii]